MNKIDPFEGYLLSAKNPLATTDQCAVEETALRLIAHPRMLAARLTAEQLFRWVMAADMGELMSHFDSFLDEYMFHYAMRAAVNDPDHPKVARFMTPPHRWFGRDVPGSRWGADSPDFVYRVITASHGSRYEIHGRSYSETRPTLTFTLLEDRQASSVPFSTLNSVDMDFEPNGDFTITVDQTPANGRRNHIQTQPGCYAVWARDALGDWFSTSPNALRVRRLDPPARERPGDDDLALWGAKAAEDGVYYLYFLTRTSWLMEPNVLQAPRPTAALGGMPGQFSAGGRLRLREDEAMVITSNVAGATFRNVVLTEPFWRTLNYWDRQTSLNAGQMEPDADGRFTFVVSHCDPGIHNWLDACGIPELRVGQRWQSFESGVPDGELEFSSKLVNFGNLDRELPRGVCRIDEDGRRQQLLRRLDGYRRRFIDR